FAFFSAVAAIEGAIEVRTPLLGEAVMRLSWLCPSKASLLALARGPVDLAWLVVRHDPGAVLLILRQAARFLPSASLSYFPSASRDPAILEGALDDVEQNAVQPAGSTREYVDWSRPELFPILRSAQAYAWTAEQIAARTGHGDANNAWVAGLLAPFG